ncbi:1-deoxy-D-xylulose-5-phosphate reductoisomerase [Schaalia sp. ZJ405]|uniref:1-deoxy-D-xylulose-5-phosphate reductoisomerase n=1 Tax=Schaalia sp. ZJ405 TaxID=2709403 RepID=UPI0013EB5EDA|nr:1-deoxy-D-xylulose-5-phosphate reductoisomerase [Schaalia sp. ZJ405]QPK82007.1 1-deoxy-D-xylulose-5-phosphate reductoisomerase [Schaalia sp. ZJ405]
MSSCRQVVVLGSTGSIGTQALDVVSQHSDRLRGVALAAGGGNIELLARQAIDHEVEVVAVASRRGSELRDAISALAPGGKIPQIIEGHDAATQIAGSFPDAVVLNGITGGVGLAPTLAALNAGSVLALANKESLVVGGPLVREALRFPGQVVPVDSEHSAIAQALASGIHEKGLTSRVVTGRTEVADLVLTASGGPFRGQSRAQLADVTPAQALAHPTWNMGPVVTINSSTLVNKGLELIEAYLLFDVDPDHIVTTVHPQSIVHSMVTWKDGATTLQASPPDMRLPIALGLTWPERLDTIEKPLTWSTFHKWTFEPIDVVTFPAVKLARMAVSESQTHPAVYNAANEALVDAFLAGRIRWLDIVDILADVLEAHDGTDHPSLETIRHVQEWARTTAEARIHAKER